MKLNLPNLEFGSGLSQAGNRCNNLSPSLRLSVLLSFFLFSFQQQHLFSKFQFFERQPLSFPQACWSDRKLKPKLGRPAASSTRPDSLAASIWGPAAATTPWLPTTAVRVPLCSCPTITQRLAQPAEASPFLCFQRPRPDQSDPVLWHRELTQVVMVTEEAAAECVSDDALQHLKTYQYSAIDKSPVSYYILRPYVCPSQPNQHDTCLGSRTLAGPVCSPH